MKSINEFSLPGKPIDMEFKVLSDDRKVNNNRIFFVPGQLPIIARNNKIAWNENFDLLSNLGAQMMRCLLNMQLVLEGAGYTMNEVAIINCFVSNTDSSLDEDKLNKIFEAISSAHFSKIPLFTISLVKTPRKKMCYVEIAAVASKNETV